MWIFVKELRYASVLRTSTASQPFGLLARFALNKAQCSSLYERLENAKYFLHFTEFLLSLLEIPHKSFVFSRENKENVICSRYFGNSKLEWNFTKIFPLTNYLLFLNLTPIFKMSVSIYLYQKNLFSLSGSVGSTNCFELQCLAKFCTMIGFRQSEKIRRSLMKMLVITRFFFRN